MKYLTIFLSCVFAFVSCKKDNCKEELRTIKNLETEYGCVNTKRTLTINLTNNCTIIRSKDSYDNLVTGSCHPEINFSTYDLVIGRQSSGNLNDTIKYDLRKACPKNELTLTVDIVQSAVTQPDNVVYHVLIPKLGDEEPINIKVIVR
jgi:hypothetical protein